MSSSSASILSECTGEEASGLVGKAQTCGPFSLSNTYSRTGASHQSVGHGDTGTTPLQVTDPPLLEEMWL